MKKYAILLCFLLFLSLFSACTVPTDTADDGKIHIVTTVFAPYDFARNIGGEYVDVTMLLPPGMDIHAYEPTPKDIVAIQNCDLFIYVGGESDAWVEEMLAAMEDVRTLKLFDCVTLLDEEIVEGMEHEHEEEDEHHHDDAEPDEHVWTSTDNAKSICEAIASALMELDPAHKAEILVERDRYIGKLDLLDTYINDLLADAQRTTMVFADRFPMRYFAEQYGLSYYAAFPGCASNTEPSAAVVAFLIDQVKAEGIPAVFYTEFSNQKMADTICEATGAVKLRMHSCHNVSQADFDAGIGYIDLMYENAASLKVLLHGVIE